MVPDEEMWLEVPMDQLQKDGSVKPGTIAYALMSIGQLRERYENLITTGKLRVVQECVVKLSDDAFWPEMPVFGCNGRGPVTNDFTWCPYCGNKIKR